jgi:hypothetical protein
LLRFAEGRKKNEKKIYAEKVIARELLLCAMDEA